MIPAYYNETDSNAANWLRLLMLDGLIAPGDVDERSIEDVTPNDLKGYTQCHFFAGIGGWSYALSLAGWPNDRPVWTGSCPCQPFSAAGKGAGFADERHLWPAWDWLISECRPSIVFGEQVANNLAWFDLVSGDLEAKGYAVGSVVMGAHSVGAPHIRQRLFFVGDSSGKRFSECGIQLRQSEHERQAIHDQSTTTGRGETGGMEHAESIGRAERRPESSERGTVRGCGPSDMGNAHDAGLQGCGRLGADSAGTNGQDAIASTWRDPDWIECRDGKRRPIESGTFPLAHGISGRVGLLRGYGNAIVPQVATAFIRAAA